MAELAEVERQRDALAAALRQVEFVDDNYGFYCPWCLGNTKNGKRLALGERPDHGPNCDRETALASVKGDE